MSTVLNRREMLRLLGSAGAAVSLRAVPLRAAEPPKRRLGVCSICYALRWPAVMRGRASLDEVLQFIGHAKAIGAGGIQTGFGNASQEFIRAVRSRIEADELYFEGQASLPHEPGDLDRFESQVRAAKEIGATVVRTACLGGRRYETFKTAQDFRQFAQKAERSLTLAEPIVRKLRMRLAVENHKDWLVPDLLGLLDRISSEYVGVCIDTGNSIALLEDPLATVEAYAPFAFSTHIKDMAVQEYQDGFLLSEVPLGEGFLDLRKIVTTLERARPEVQFTLEMITRDPLKVPCLAKDYWATLEAVPAPHLAGTLALVRAKAWKQDLPRVTGLSLEEKQRLEDENVKKCLEYARTQLGL